MAIQSVKRNSNNQIESLESHDSTWWVTARGGKGSPRIDDEDARSISGPVRLDSRPYPRRYVGYGRIAAALAAIGDAPIGIDEATDQPILSEETVERLVYQQAHGL